MLNKIDVLLEEPWKRSYLHVMLKERGIDKLVSNGNYSFSRNNNDFIRRFWSDFTTYTLLDPFRMGVLIDLLESCVDIPGDIVEAGSYRGGTGLFMAMWLKENKIDKKIHLFDSFEGLPETNKSKDAGYRKGEFKSDFTELKRNVIKFGFQDSITIHKGWFDQTIPTYARNCDSICLLHIDCDLYTSTVQCLEPLQDFVSEDGIVIFDDFNDGGGGEKRAFKETRNHGNEIVVGPAPQAYYVNRQNYYGHNNYQNTEIQYDINKILENESYLNWLRDVPNFNFEILLKQYLK